MFVYVIVTRQLPKRRLLMGTLFTFSLMFLPELLKHGRLAIASPPVNDVVRIELKVDGMGCEACESAVIYKMYFFAQLYMLKHLH